MAFLDDIKTGCIKGWEEFKVLPSLTAAQAILESGWGKYAPHNSLFGIKADSSWTGKSFNSKTQEEYQPGVMTNIVDRFRAYYSWTDSIVDHGKFLNDNPRYSKVIGETDYKKACHAIKDAGYATASGYAELLIQLIEENNLQSWDIEVIGKGESMTDSIAEMRRLQSIPVKYDMGDRYGNDADGDGRIEMDCSSAVSKAVGLSMNNNTETLQQSLPTIGYTKIHDAVDGTFDMKAYDVIIWAPRDGSSSLGAFGHVLIATNSSHAIHCNYGSDGITENDYNYIWDLNGRPREIVFRKGASTPKSKPFQKSAFEKELDVKARLSKSTKPYYEATLSEDYFVETGPTITAVDKEFLHAGTRVRVYEKLNGWSRINHPESAQWVEDKYLVDATDM